ncbi:class I SAM-dependent methyltransferase [Rhodocista pekingensis]|uniref:Class I SAM-dependent methyltransferase n=1 Tax=Rhodocista pekingensis TaxID=201185 RepID=A0ABW2KYD2_9PROT
MGSAHCPICDSASVRDLHARRDFPVFQNVAYASAAAAQAAPTGQLRLFRCDACGFVWNAAFDPALTAYDGSYENCQTHSAVFGRHVGEVMAAILDRLPPGERPDVVEVGCGQGDFLRGLLAAHGDRLGRAAGFDPALRKPAPDGRPVLAAGLLDADALAATGVRPGLVISRHTIEHVPDPRAFLRSILDAVRTVDGVRLVLETPDVDWILRNGAIEDLFYEHCSLFSGRALELALAATGFAVDRIERVFGDQYLLCHAHARRAGEVLPDPTEVPMDPAPAGAALARRTAALSRSLARLSGEGTVALWGAGAKGCTFALLMQEAGVRPRFAVDINPAKQGRFLPKSALPILSPADARTAGADHVIVLNPMYLDEIRALCRQMGWAVPLIAIDTLTA